MIAASMMPLSFWTSSLPWMMNAMLGGVLVGLFGVGCQSWMMIANFLFHSIFPNSSI